MNGGNLMDKDPFKEYIKQSEPNKRDKGYAWHTAIGLQAVDGLKTSKYLIDTAIKNIEGDISIDEAQELLNTYYEENPKADIEDRTEEADKVAVRIAKILSEKAFSFTPNEYISIHKKLFTGIYGHAGKLRDYNITKKEWVLNGATILYGSASELRATLLNQWVDELNHFLEIREEPPEYETKTGRKKKRNSVIGVLHGNKNTLTGIIDVAMVGSMYSRGKFNERINYYGMVIMDECHHAASNTSMELLQKINAKYVYGVSATPKRGDSLDRIIYMLLGPLRHRFTALERAKEQGIGHYFVPRYTRVVDTAESKDNINKA